MQLDKKTMIDVLKKEDGRGQVWLAGAIARLELMWCKGILQLGDTESADLKYVAGIIKTIKQKPLSGEIRNKALALMDNGVVTQTLWDDLVTRHSKVENEIPF